MPIITGQALAIVKQALSLETIDLKGLHCHIGSQILEMAPFRNTAAVMMDFLKEIKVETGYELEELNLGGGMGIYYASGDEPIAIKEFASPIMALVQRKAQELKIEIPKIIIEPGRSIIGPAGITLYTIGTVKKYLKFVPIWLLMVVWVIILDQHFIKLNMRLQWLIEC